MQESKSIFLSKTFWFNVVSLVLAVLTSILDQNLIAEHPQVVKIFMVIISMGNVFLRYLTDTPVHISRSR